MEIFSWLPKEGSEILSVLFLCFLIGLQREERKTSDDHFSIGGVRTYPMIGVAGYATSLLSSDTGAVFVIGFVVICCFLLIAYLHKIKVSGYANVTTEMSALITYLVGGLVQHDLLWIATTLVVSVLLLLELKSFLEGIAKTIDPNNILAFTKFLLLSAVILPLLPNKTFTTFEINPLKIWLVVIAVSGVSYVSFLLQKIRQGSSGIRWSAILGGIYSSTATTVVLAKRSNELNKPQLFSGCILAASGIMYLRLLLLIGLFNLELAIRLALPFSALAILAISFGLLWSRDGKGADSKITNQEIKNPLELGTAFLFGFVCVLMIIATHLAETYLGKSGIFALAGIVGFSDVDPFVMGLAQTMSNPSNLDIAAIAILITTGSNNLIKGVYAAALSTKRAGIESFVFLFFLAVLGAIPIYFLD